MLFYLLLSVLLHADKSSSFLRSGTTEGELYALVSLHLTLEFSLR